MTRINLVDPSSLSDQHLFAEWREIKMVPAALRRSLRTQTEAAVLKKIPNCFTLNAGHVLFFYDKMRFLHNRYGKLTDELSDRGYNLTEHDADIIFYSGIPESFKAKEWTPDDDDRQESIDRILLRLSEREGWYRRHGVVQKSLTFKYLMQPEDFKRVYFYSETSYNNSIIT